MKRSSLECVKVRIKMQGILVHISEADSIHCAVNFYKIPSSSRVTPFVPPVQSLADLALCLSLSLSLCEKIRAERRARSYRRARCVSPVSLGCALLERTISKVSPHSLSLAPVGPRGWRASSPGIYPRWPECSIRQLTLARATRAGP